MPKRIKKLLSVFATSSCFILFFFTNSSFSEKVWANPISPDNVTVSLTIADQEPPSTPVLKSPGNNAYVTDNTPTFSWEESSDDRGIDHYQFYLNGNLLYDGLPTTNKETDNYTYEYDSINNKYNLTPKTAISDGTHTWKIRVYDNNSNHTDSATWTFNVDTQAPNFVITNIGELETSISAQDPSTVPLSPLELEENEPLVVANGEVNGSVQVVLTVPDDPTQSYTTSIDSGGNWDLQLGVLPRDVIVTMDIVITDSSGLISTISNLQFLVKPIVIVLFPSPSSSATPSATPILESTPSPTPDDQPDDQHDDDPKDTPSPSPSETPAIITKTTPSPPPEATFIPSLPPIPSIKIELTPPREVIINVIQEIGESLPEPVKVAIKAIPGEVIGIAEDVAPVSAAVVATTIPAVSTVAVASQFGGNLSFSIIIKILQALGLIPVGKPQGIVFNSETYEPISFALLTIKSRGNALVKTTETVVTDINGVYRGVKLSPGEYKIEVSHQDFIFPASQKRPQYLEFKDFYLGETFKVSDERQKQLFLIPVEPKEKTNNKSFKNRFKIFLSRTSRLIKHLTVPMFFISGFLAILFPSIWNGAVLGFYTLLVGKKLVKFLKLPVIKGLVTDENGIPLENAVVRISLPMTNELISVISTDDDGEFEIFAPKNLYQMEITLPGYIWRETAQTMSSYEVDARKKKQEVVAVMTLAEQVYKEVLK